MDFRRALFKLALACLWHLGTIRRTQTQEESACGGSVAVIDELRNRTRGCVDCALACGGLPLACTSQ